MVDEHWYAVCTLRGGTSIASRRITDEEIQNVTMRRELDEISQNAA